MITTLRIVLSTLVGTLIVAVGPTPADATIGQCPSGSFCVWSSSNYSGTFKAYPTVGAYRSINQPTGSYFNNRSKRTWLHDQADGSGTHACIPAGGRKAVTSGWQASAETVWLSTTTAC